MISPGIQTNIPREELREWQDGFETRLFARKKLRPLHSAAQRNRRMER